MEGMEKIVQKCFMNNHKFNYQLNYNELLKNSGEIKPLLQNHWSTKYW